MRKKIAALVVFAMVCNMFIGLGGDQASAAAIGTPDLDPPKLLTYENTNNLTKSPLFQLNMDEPVVVKSGTITLQNRTTGGLVDTIDISRLNKITDDKYQFQLNTGVYLDFNTVYDATISAGAFEDLAGIPSDLIQFAVTTAGETAPAIVKYTPSPDASTVNPSEALVIDFSEDIYYGNGQISILRLSDNVLVDQFAISGSTTDSSRVAIAGKTVTIRSGKLAAGTSHYVLIDNGAFVDGDGTAFTGISNGRQWTFTTAGAAAQVTSKYPETGTQINTTSVKLQLNYNKKVYPGTGNIELYQADGTRLVSIPVSSSQVTGGGTSTITIDPKVTLKNNTSYYVLVPDGAFRDQDNISIAGYTNANGWRFSVTPAVTPITVTSLSPSNGSTGVASTVELIINFDRQVLRGTGAVVVRKVGSNVSIPVVATADGTTQGRIRLQSGSVYESGASYYVTMESGAFYERANQANLYAGMSGQSSWTFQVGSIDKIAPVLQNAQMHTYNTIRLTYSESLNSGISLLTSSFAVTVNGENRPISSAYVSGDSVYVTLSTGVAVGQKVTISFSGGNGRPVQDLAGNAASAFSTREVVNGIDTIMPKPISGTAYGSTISLQFSESMKSPSSNAYNQFHVTADGSTIGVRSISVSGNYITLYLNSSIGNGQVVKVSYTPGSYPIESYSYNQHLAAFTDYMVRNQLDTKAPVFEKVEASGNKMVLIYNEPLSKTNLPMKSQFSVLVNNAPLYVNQVEIKDNQVILTLASNLPVNQKVTLSYVPGVNRITDMNGNAAGYINLHEVIAGAATTTHSDVKSAQINGDTITIVFNKVLASQVTTSAVQFTILVDNVYRTISHASISGDTLTIKLSSPVQAGQKVEFSYAPGVTPIKDSTGVNIASIANLQISNGSTAAVSNGLRPSYLTVLNASEFGYEMQLLGIDAATSTEDQSQFNNSTRRYMIDSDKLRQAYSYLTTSNQYSRIIVFQTPSSMKSGYVGVPLKTLEDAYKNDNKAAFAVKWNDNIYMLKLSNLNFSAIAQQFNSTTAAITLYIQLEELPNANLVTLQQKMNLVGAKKVTPSIEIHVSAASNTSASTKQDVVLVNGEFLLRTSKTDESSVQHSLVTLNEKQEKLTYVPTLVQTVGSYRLYNAKVNGNLSVSGITLSMYFTDTHKHWAKDTILELASKLVIDGRTSTSFMPNKMITRAEFAEFIARGLNLSMNVEGAPTFKDVKPGSSAGLYISAAAKAGIITGYHDGTFKPESYITREQMSIMMVRAMESIGYDASLSYSSDITLNKFKDKTSISSSSRDLVAKAVNEGIIQGVTSNTFQPAGNATRAQAAVMLKRMLSKIQYI